MINNLESGMETAAESALVLGDSCDGQVIEAQAWS